MGAVQLAAFPEKSVRRLIRDILQGHTVTVSVTKDTANFRREALLAWGFWQLKWAIFSRVDRIASSCPSVFLQPDAEMLLS